METVTSRDGTTIAYERTGEGPAVVLVTGATCDRHMHDGLAALLSEHFTVFNYDRRGRGDSGDGGRLDDAPDTALRQESDDLRAVIDAAGGGAHVFGSSSGAMLVLRAAAHGVPVAGLALWEPPVGLDEEDRRGHLEYVARLHELLADDRRGDAAALFLSQVGMPAEMIEGARGEPWWAGMEKLAPSLRYDAAALGQGLLDTTEAARVTAPALVLEDELSPEFLRKAAQGVTAALPNARHGVLKGQDHNFAAEVMAQALAEFFLTEQKAG
ncbi:alpha/beta fold hydrolase [Actinomadura hibisca]|uniref:alpha/beta fold hydrolase n=1 Tax=Actinomadura hibisca TaxID=68565 RepID=UPI00083327A1|nr:alpha/beta hydrolase [Actinomadura hibisca]